MSILNEVVRHFSREAPRHIVQFCKEHQVLEKTGDAISSTASQALDAVKDLQNSHKRRKRLEEIKKKY